LAAAATVLPNETVWRSSASKMRTMKPPTPLQDCTTHGISSFGLFLSAVRQSFGLAEVYWFCAVSAEAPYAPNAHSPSAARSERRFIVIPLNGLAHVTTRRG
jgi:hypothetical protein